MLGTAEAQARNGTAGAHWKRMLRLTALFLWTMQSTGRERLARQRQRARMRTAEEASDAMTTRTKRPAAEGIAGYNLPFDVARRFAQPLGIHLDDWESRIIKTEKGVVRLLPVSRSAGRNSSGSPALPPQPMRWTPYRMPIPPAEPVPGAEPPAVRGRARRRGSSISLAAGDMEPALSATTLDRVHAAMLLQASGRSQALRNLLRAEQERSPDFLRLANALTALYPRSAAKRSACWTLCCWQRRGSQKVWI